MDAVVIIDPNVSVEFEVFGKVQGCSFTKYCKDLCEELGIAGWVKNTRKGTISGKLQGPKSKVEQMQLNKETMFSKISRNNVDSATVTITKDNCSFTIDTQNNAKVLVISLDARFVEFMKRVSIEYTLKQIYWLSNTGSPGCHIERCDLNNWQMLAKRDYTNFCIRF